jgi:hypothetical protein
MKLLKYSLFLIFAAALASCEPGNNNAADERNVPDSTKTPADTVPKRQFYSNDRFKDVWVERYNDTVFIIRGKARVFEAQFSYVIEDGHDELRAGSGHTDAGAPAWGKFRVPIYIRKIDPNSTLTLVLFEASPKDGSRQGELAVPLF